MDSGMEGGRVVVVGLVVRGEEGEVKGGGGVSKEREGMVVGGGS